MSVTIPSYVLTFGDDEDDKREIARFFEKCEMPSQIQSCYNMHRKFGKYKLLQSSNGNYTLLFQNHTKEEDIADFDNIRITSLPPVAIDRSDIYKINPNVEYSDENILKITTPASKSKQTLNVNNRWFITSPNCYSFLTIRNQDSTDGQQIQNANMFKNCEPMINDRGGPSTVIIQPKIVIVPKITSMKQRDQIMENISNFIKSDHLKTINSQHISITHIDDNKKWFTSIIDCDYVYDYSLERVPYPSNISSSILNVRLNSYNKKPEETILQIFNTVTKKRERLHVKGEFKYVGLDDIQRQIYEEWSKDSEFMFSNISRESKTSRSVCFSPKNIKNDIDNIDYLEFDQGESTKYGMVILNSLDDLKSACDFTFRLSDILSKEYSNEGTIENDENDRKQIADEFRKWSSKTRQKEKTTQKQTPNYHPSGLPEYSQRFSNQPQDGTNYQKPDDNFVMILSKWMEIIGKKEEIITEKSWKSIEKHLGVSVFEQTESTFHNNIKSILSIFSHTNCGVQLVFHQDFNLRKFMTSTLDILLITAWNGWVNTINDKMQKQTKLEKKRETTLNYINGAANQDFDISKIKQQDDCSNIQSSHKRTDFKILVHVNTFMKTLAEIYITTLSTIRLLRRAFRKITPEKHFSEHATQYFNIYKKQQPLTHLTNITPNMVIITDIPDNIEPDIIKKKNINISQLQRNLYALDYKKKFLTEKRPLFENSFGQDTWICDYDKVCERLFREVSTSYALKKTNSEIPYIIPQANIWDISIRNLVISFDIRLKHSPTEWRETNLSKCDKTHEQSGEIKKPIACKLYLEDCCTQLYSNIENTKDRIHNRNIATYHPSDKNATQSDNITVECKNIRDNLYMTNFNMSCNNVEKDDYYYWIDFYRHLRNDALRCTAYEGLDFITWDDYNKYL